VHGELEPDQVRAQLQRADAFLHASLSEGLPNVVLEAMACGLPVVATDVGGTSEAVRDGSEGFLIAPRDPRAAATTLAALWRDRGLRERMGRAGRARVEAEFRLARQTDEWMELYDAVARAPRRDRAPAPAAMIAASVDDPLVSPQLTSSRPPPLRILSVGPLAWSQGYEHALMAVKRLLQRGVACHYRIVGAGEHSDALVFARHQLGLQGCVEFVEPGSHEDLRAELSWASVLVEAAVQHPSPSTVLDAQGAGVPVVTTAPPPAHSDTVLAAPSRDPDALSEKIELLARDGPLRARLVRAGRLRALGASGPAAGTPALATSTTTRSGDD
jgi:glycosyltransferase involved in cell wall biosynthesis